MLIPVKCFTCGKVIADKYYKYKSEVVSRKQAVGIDPEKIQYLSEENNQKSKKSRKNELTSKSIWEKVEEQ